jgi:hypothetical protein
MEAEDIENDLEVLGVYAGSIATLTTQLSNSGLTYLQHLIQEEFNRRYQQEALNAPQEIQAPR